MSMQETLADMAALAAKLEAEGAEIISAGISMVTGPQLHLSRHDLPPSIEERGALHGRRGGYTEYGYTDGGVSVFWMEG